MSEDLEIIVCREDKPDDEEEILVNKNDKVLKILKLAKVTLYPDENVLTADLFAYQVKEGEKSLLKRTTKISELTDVDQIEIRHKPSKKEEKDCTDQDNVDGSRQVEKLKFKQTVEKLNVKQKEEIRKIREAKEKIDAARKEVSSKSESEEKNEILQKLKKDFGINDEIPDSKTRENAEQTLNDLAYAVEKEESELASNTIDFNSFSVKDRCQELMTHISGNCVSFEIEQPIVSNVTNEKIYKCSSEELHRQASNKMFSTSEDGGWKIGVDAAVPINTYCNISSLVGHGREESTSSEGGRKKDNIKRSSKATVSSRHYQQIIKFKITKTNLSIQCEKDAKQLGEVHKNNDPNVNSEERTPEERALAKKALEDRALEEKALIDFLKKYPEKVYTGPFGAGGWFEFITTVETSQDEDISILRNMAIDQNQRHSKIASNIRVAGIGGGGFEFGNQESSRNDKSNETFSQNASSGYIKNTTFVCEGPLNTRTPTSLTARLTSPDNWTVFPSCDEKTPSAFLTPIHDIIQNIGDEKEDANLQRAAKKIKDMLRNGPKYIIREANIPQKALKTTRLKNVMCFGKTGQGKSMLGNVLLGNYDAFQVSEGTTSCTKKSKDVDNYERRIRIHDTYGLSDTDDRKAGMHYLVGSKKAMEEVLQTWLAIGTEGLDAVIFVQNRGQKVTSEDAALAKYAKEKLFGDDIGERAFLVMTQSTPVQISDESARLKFLEEESRKESGHFADLYELVNSDPKKVIFVDNKNPDPRVCGQNEVIKVKQDNVLMAELVLQAIHNIDLPPQPTPIKILEVRRMELQLEVLNILASETEDEIGLLFSQSGRTPSKNIFKDNPVKSKELLEKLKDGKEKKKQILSSITELGLKSSDIHPKLNSVIDELKGIEEEEEKLAKRSIRNCSIL